MKTEPTHFDDLNQLIDFAIEREREAQELYLSYIKNTKRVGFRQLLISMVEMEKEHEKKLVELRTGRRLNQIFPSSGKPDLKISEYLVDIEYSSEMDYGDFLILVIKKESGTEKLYTDLESLATGQGGKQFFRVLADEERKHKMWAQDRYDLEILKEN